MIKKMEHVGIVVSNMDASITFYQEALGLSLRSREFLTDQVELAFLAFSDAPDFELELISGKELPESEGKVNHLAFTVDHIEDEIRRLSALGVTMKNFEPRIILNNKVKIAFFEGPDGEILELVEK